MQSPFSLSVRLHLFPLSFDNYILYAYIKNKTNMAKPKYFDYFDFFYILYIPR